MNYIRTPLLDKLSKAVIDSGVRVNTVEPVHIPEVIIEPKDLQPIDALVEKGVLGLVRLLCPCKDSYLVSWIQLLSEIVDIVLRPAPALRRKHMNDITNSHQFDSSADSMDGNHINPLS
jgi:hypothetical protein